MTTTKAVKKYGGIKADIGASFPWGNFLVEWFDDAGIHPLTDNRVAKISLDERHEGSSYHGFRLEIIHKLNGRVDSHDFDFDDYFDKDRSKVKDVRCEGRGYAAAPLEFHCFRISYQRNTNKWEWHLAEPIDKSPITMAIAEYVRRFK